MVTVSNAVAARMQACILWWPSISLPVFEMMTGSPLTTHLPFCMSSANRRTIERLMDLLPALVFSSSSARCGVIFSTC
jgi:hypothetical protein